MRQCLMLTAVAVLGVVVQGAEGRWRAARGDVRWGDLPHTDTVFEPRKYASLTEWKRRRQWLRDQVRFAAGLCPEPEGTPLNARISGKLERDGYTVEKVCFESRPGFYVTGNLYRPRGVKARVPAVACPHGHWPKGRLNHEERGSIPARCITLARLGAVVFSYDMIGFADSKRQIDHRDRQVNSPASALWGIGSLALQTFNSIRVLDFLQSLPEVDPDRIGVTGASGGGTQTFILSAIDDRVKVAAPVNMISSTMQGGCICENAPLLRIETNNMEIGALFAPKPLLLVSATGDWTKNTPKVEYPMIRGVYELYGAADRVANVHVDAEHNYNLASREAMYRFFGKWLLKRDDAESITEGEVHVEKPEDLLVFSDDNLPSNMLTADQIVDQEKAAVHRHIDSLEPTSGRKLDELSRLVGLGVEHAVASVFPRKGDVSREGREIETRGLWPCDEMVYARNRRRVSALRFSSHLASIARDSVTICVHPKGLAAADRIQEAQVNDAGPILSFIRLQANLGHYVLVVEPFGTGSARRPQPVSKPRFFEKYFTTFNRTDAAETIFDILTVLAVELRHGCAPPVCLVGFGEMGPMCLLARTLVPDELAEANKLRTVVDLNGFDVASDEAYVKQLFLPNIRRIGGLRAAAAVAASGPIWLHNTGDKFDADWAKAAGKILGVEVRVDKDPADPLTIPKWLRADQ